MDNFDSDRRCGCIPPKHIEPCRSPGILGYVMTVVLIVFLVCSFGETLWNSFLRIFQMKPTHQQLIISVNAAFDFKAWGRFFLDFGFFRRKKPIFLFLRYLRIEESYDHNFVTVVKSYVWRTF